MEAVIPPSTLPERSAHNVLKRNGRSFHFASRVLGKSHAGRAARLYAFCRMLDDVADSATDAQASLSEISAMLSGSLPPTHAGVIDYLKLADETGMALEPARALIAGLQTDQDEVALQSADALVRYSYHVAGTVGVMMCAVLDCTDPDAQPFAIDLGIAMQLSNIARDIAEDARMGRRYLPESWTGAASPADILAAITNTTALTPRLVDARDRAVAMAELYYASGFAGLAYLPLRSRLSILVAGSVYREIGRKARARASASIGVRQVVTGPQKLAIACLALSRHISRSDFHRPEHDHDATLHTPIRDCFGANRAGR
jgi:15-cis-phytoene synthase